MLTAVRSIEDSSGRVYALGELAPRLPAERAEVLAEALTVARSIEDSFSVCVPFVNWHRTYQ